MDIPQRGDKKMIMEFNLLMTIVYVISMTGWLIDLLSREQSPFLMLLIVALGGMVTVMSIAVELKEEPKLPETTDKDE